MTSKPDEQQRAVRFASKQDRERDAAAAMQEYQAEKAAVLAKTAKLRAARLAGESANQIVDRAASAKKDQPSPPKIARKTPRAAAKRAVANKTKSPKR